MVVFARNNKYIAFSLMEVSIVLVLVTILIALVFNIFVLKIKKANKSVAHGRFECYWSNGKVYERNIQGDHDFGVSVSKYPDKCEFIPDKYANYIVINISGGGAAYNIYEKKGGSAGEFKNLLLKTLMYKYFLFPAKPSASPLGNSSYISGFSSSKSSSEKQIIIAKGGDNDYGIQNTTIDNVSDCAVVKSPPWSEFQCGSSPKCQINGDSIEVSYCGADESYKNDKLSYKSDILSAPRGILTKNKNNAWNYYSLSYYKDMGCNPLSGTAQNEKCYIYQKNFSLSSFKNMTNRFSPCMYKLELLIDMPKKTKEGEVSLLTKYITSLKYEDGIA